MYFGKSESELIELAKKSTGYSELLRTLGFNPHGSNRKKMRDTLDDIGFKKENFYTTSITQRSQIYKYSDDEFKLLVATSINYVDILRKLNVSSSGNSSKVLKDRISVLNIDISHFTTIVKPQTNLSIDEILCKGSITKNTRIVEILIDNGLKDYCCENCGLSNTDITGQLYSGSLTLDLHHIDGDSTNNSLENLNLLCPNCHRITDNFGSKNRRKMNKLSKKEIVEVSSI